MEGVRGKRWDELVVVRGRKEEWRKGEAMRYCHRERGAGLSKLPRRLLGRGAMPSVRLHCYL